MRKLAIFSNDNKYRYILLREWDNSKPNLGFIMLNPSTADGEKDDPTIRRCISFAKDNGFGSILVVNICAYRSTNPKLLKNLKIPFDHENFTWIETIAVICDKTILAYGNSVEYAPNYQKTLSRLHKLKPLYCLGLTKKGHPRHPLYISKNQRIVKFQGRGA